MTNPPDHDHPHANNPHAPKAFDFERYQAFCSRGFSSGVGQEGGQVCIEAAISLCMGEGLGDKPTCVRQYVHSPLQVAILRKLGK